VSSSYHDFLVDLDRNTRNKGAPINEIRIPSGISSEVADRATLSIKSIKILPDKKEAGSRNL